MLCWQTRRSDKASTKETKARKSNDTANGNGSSLRRKEEVNNGDDEADGDDVEANGVELFEHGIAQIRDDDIVEGNSSLPAHIYPRGRIDDETAQTLGGLSESYTFASAQYRFVSQSSACREPVAIPLAQHIFHAR